MELLDRLQDLASRHITPMVAEDLPIFLKFLDQHGFEIKEKARPRPAGKRRKVSKRGVIK